MLWNDSVEDQSLGLYTCPLTAVPLCCAIDLVIRMVRRASQWKAAGCSGKAGALTRFRNDPSEGIEVALLGRLLVLHSTRRLSVRHSSTPLSS